jgi:predicted dehydrogenase
MPSLNFHFTPNYVKAKQLIESGAVGKVSALGYREWIPAADLAKQWPPDSWMGYVEESGGPLVAPLPSGDQLRVGRVGGLGVGFSHALT